MREDNKESSQSVRTAVFDVCDTLYYSNTTHDFVRFILDGEPLSTRKIIYRLLNGKLSPLRYFLITLSIKTRRDFLRLYNIWTLKDKTKGQLDDLARRFVGEFLQNRKIDRTQDLIRIQQNAGLRVVLCSSSIEPAVKAVADDLGISDYVATSLEYDGEIFTGRIEKDITWDKLQALRDRNLLGKLVYAASDNVSDCELLSAADQALVVIHKNKKEEFWRKYDFEVIAV